MRTAQIRFDLEYWFYPNGWFFAADTSRMVKNWTQSLEFIFHLMCASHSTLFFVYKYLQSISRCRRLLSRPFSHSISLDFLSRASKSIDRMATVLFCRYMYIPSWCLKNQSTQKVWLKQNIQLKTSFFSCFLQMNREIEIFGKSSGKNRYLEVNGTE